MMIRQLTIGVLSLCLVANAAHGQASTRPVDDAPTPAIVAPPPASDAALPAPDAPAKAPDAQAAIDPSTQGFESETLPSLPVALRGPTVSANGGALIVVGGTRGDGTPNRNAYVLPSAKGSWVDAGAIAAPVTAAASVSDGVVAIGGDQTRLLTWADGKLSERSLPAPLASIARGAATAIGRTVYLVDGAAGTFAALDLAAESPAWKALPALPAASIDSPAIVALQGTLYLFGSVDGKPAAFAYTARDGWKPRAAPPRWPDGAADAAVAYGHAHVFVFAATSGRDVPTYHAITDTWLTIPLAEPIPAGATPVATSLGKRAVVLVGDAALSVAPRTITTNYGWIDHAVVALYLLGMVGMGWYFAGREKNTEDIFRGGKRIPWWATGMSLFATGASAISLMSMPGKAYQADWAYFAISIFSLLVLPVSMYFLAPLVRRLNIATSNEYLERRFGIQARLFASSIYCFTTICGRMAPVLLMPSIALSAITGIDIVWSILIMGAVTTIYTFLGGLEAVIWTDTVQGLIMCGAVAGCLLLAIFKLSAGPGAMWDTAASAGKLHLFDWSFDLVYPVAWAFLISTIVGTLAGVGDQNFVQRVQCTPTLRDARKAVATQLAVAVPINVLLFSLGTALWLFYRGRPERLNPNMETDGVFPFFVAQQLPPGVSGLVVAALLAATMSTISSSICAVADLGVNDFYRRFSTRATERSSYVLGRVLMGCVGVAGTALAIGLGRLGAASVWDLALLVTGLISNGIIGLFWVGLLTTRAKQSGALVGVACGMATVVCLQQFTTVHFLWYQAVGAMVTIVTGYLFSFVLPGRAKDLAGLTIFTLPPRGLDDDAPMPATELRPEVR